MLLFQDILVKTSLLFISVTESSYFVTAVFNNGEKDSSAFWHLAQQFSLYESDYSESYESNGYEEKDQEPAMFQEKDLQNYRDIFKFAYDIVNTPLGDILEHGSFPSEDLLFDGQRFEKIFAELTYSQELNKLLPIRLKSLLLSVSRRHNNARDTWQWDSDVSIADLGGHGADNEEDMEQVGDWEGCRRDYNALALPWTNNMMGRIARSVIDQVFPDAEENLDCNEACDTICQNFTDLSNCSSVCTILCWQLDSSNATYDGVVDFIIEILFPQKNKTFWHRAIFDAMAKVPPAIVHGNIHWVGGYDRCVSIEVNHTYTEDNITGLDIVENRHFTGQYYRIPLKPPLLQNRSLELLYGACVPSTCNKEDVIRYITKENDLFRLLKSTLKWEINEEKMFNGTHPKDDPKPAGLIILIIILVITVVLLVLPATVYDVYFREWVMRKHVDKINNARITHRKNLLSQMSYESSLDNKTETNISDSHQKPALFHSVSTQSTKSLIESYSPTEVESGSINIWDRLEVLFVAFSAYSNYIRMFRIRNLDTDLPALDCVRFLSYGWAILGFTWLLGPIAGTVWLSANLFHVLRTYIPSWSYQAVINFHFASDSFYVISGILVAYWWLIDYGGKHLTVMGWVKTVLLFYLRRYWRVIPALMFTILFYFTTYKVFTGGPFSSSEIGDAENCRLNWWTNLLMLNNLVNTEKSCVTWTWYISTWYQLIIMCPLVLVPLVIKPILGYGALVAVYILHLAITAGIIGGLTGNDNLTLGNWATDYFVTPWCRAGPFCIGMAYGILLQQKKKELDIPKWLVVLGGAVSLTLILSVTYGTYGQFKEGGELWGRDARVMYNVFSRSAFGLGLGFIILMCCTGNGGFIGELINWRGFQPLSRMTYCAFLFSSPLIYTQAFGRRDALWITTKSITHMFLTNMVTTFTVGFVATGALFHYPYSLGVERALRVKTKEECIKAGRHPEIVPLIPNLATGNDKGFAHISDVYNDLYRSDHTDQKEYDHVGFSRMDSTTSM